MALVHVIENFEFFGWDYKYVSFIEAVWRLSAALFLSLIVGLDRELKHKAVGMRAFMLASVGAAGYALLSLELTGGFAPDIAADGDPTRIMAGLMGAFGFLGAGAIIQSRGDVQGFASGAAIWTAGAIGMGCGLGYVGLSALLATMTLLILIVSEFFQKRSAKLDERGAVRGTETDD